MSYSKDLSKIKISAALLKIVAIALVFLSANVNAQFHVIPQPVKITAGRGKFILTKNAVIGVDKQSLETGRYLQSYLAESYNLHLKLRVFNRTPFKTTIRLVAKNDTVDGAYSLSITPRLITVTGASAGVFYGVQSLLQLLPGAGASSLPIPACNIYDEPRFKWRGLSLDVCRHFYTVAQVKKYIDVMAHYKLNIFHWHLTDDEGWRIRIDKYPLLTQVGSRVSYYAKLGKFRKLDNLIDGGNEGFYTKEDIREVIRYAKERFVTILPEIEMPGHSEAAIFAYPQLGCQDSTGAQHRVQMLDPSEYNFTFYENVLTEVMALFPNPYIHIGGDEAEMANWLKSPTAVALMKREGLKNEREVQSYFIKRIEKFLISKNKRLIGWDEILQGGLAESATVMSWQGEAGGIAAARMHHQVVMTPLPYMYFDAPQARESLEPIGWNPPVPWQMVYNYEPMSNQLTPDEAKYVIGVQGNIWAEKIPNFKHLLYLVYPRALAVAEIGWSPKAERDIDRFAVKMKAQYSLFKLWGLNARIPNIDSLGDVTTNNDKYTFTLNYPLKGAKLRYAVNAIMPDSNSVARTFPVRIDTALKDTLRINAFTSWKLDNHIRQTALIRHVTIAPAADSSKISPGLTYAVYKTAKYYNKLDSVSPAGSGLISFPQRFVLAPEGIYTWVKLNGLLKIDHEGDYILTSGFENSPQLSLGGAMLISMDRDSYVEPQKALLHLKKGYYDLKGIYLAGDFNNGQNLIQLQTSDGRVLDPATYLFHF